MLLSPGTISQEQIPIKLKVCKINLQICVTDDFMFDFPRNYKTLERLGLRTLHSRRRHLYALFLINVFNNTIDCQSIRNIVSLRVPSKLFRVSPFLVLVKRWDLVLQLCARPWPVIFINLWVFLKVRLFRYLDYYFAFLIFLLFVLYLLPCCSLIYSFSCWVSTIKIKNWIEVLLCRSLDFSK
jgi:hypothetical protein